ncbi:hypothetical protein AVEN_134444-1 [Araneus ventricosus]|uniref:Uncharacterized protein n=1 Tax=Araneus ventricosus TaxID=182803 RepID=A0A4Y2K262_ARAVE|nr:hypothetical protein AVEN_134444-1 [Araneus ventricosus]
MQNRASEQSYEDGREKSQRARVSYYRREEIKAEKTIITMRWVAGRYRNLKEQLDSELDNQEELQLLNVRIKRGNLQFSRDELTRDKVVSKFNSRQEIGVKAEEDG